MLFDVSELEGVKSAIEILSWLIFQYETSDFVTVKTSDGRVFKSRVSVSGASEGLDRHLCHVICIHDSGELNSAVMEQDRYKYLLDTAMDSIPDGFAVYDQDDRLQIFNKAYADVYKRSGSIIKIGETFENILRHGLKVRQYLEAGTTKKSQEAWLSKRLELHKNPTDSAIQNVGDRWIRVEERKLDDGRTVGIRADITQLVEAKSAAEVLGNILDDMAAPVVFTNLLTLKFEYANKAALNKLGYTIEEFVELKPTDIYLSLSADQRDEFIERALDNPGTAVSFRSVHVRKDGTTYPCVVNSVCETKSGSQRLISFIQDETEEVRMRNELEVERAQFETVVYSLPCLIMHSKPDTTILFANEEYLSFYSYKPDQMINKKFIEFDQHVDRSKFLTKIDELSAEFPIFSREEEGIDKDGNKYTIFWTNRMLFKNGEPIALVSVGRNITDVRNAKMRIQKQAHQLELRNNALEQFAGIVSHDLRSPLRHIRMFGEMLMEDYEKQKFDNFSQYIGKMREGVLRMDSLIGSLLEFSQVAYKQVNRSEFKLGAAVEEAKDNLATAILDKKAIVYINDDDITLRLDYILFVQLLENLIDNSVKYYDGVGAPEIHINGTCDHDTVVITITDNGIGIPPEHSERIFNVFQRLHIDEKIYKGTGIGLALAKRIVEGHNGKIMLDKDFVDGTKFVISLPLGS